MNSTGGKIFKLTGKVQNYAWGGKDFIPQLLGVKATEKTAAEYWLGAHQSAPSKVTDESNEAASAKSLDEMISDDAELTLGNNVNEAFGRLPYLLKVLDVKDMLSIQVHPSKIEAEKGFARENEAGISLNDPKRNYKDDNHKPELMLALGDFWLLHGFKAKDQLIEILSSVPELQHLVAIFENAGYEGLYHTVMQLPQEKVNNILQPLLDRIIPLYRENKLNKSQEDFWAARAALTYNQSKKENKNANSNSSANLSSTEQSDKNAEDLPNIDRGIFSVYFLNLVHLQRGEAIFQDAGILHAYLEGQNIEIMANSDNVLRGGLTPKNIDIEELMKHVIFEPVDPWIIQGTVENGERVYKTPANDFELSSFELNAGESAAFNTDTADILLVTKGRITIDCGEQGEMSAENDVNEKPRQSDNFQQPATTSQTLNKTTNQHLELAKGESAIIFRAQPARIHALEPSMAFRATVPVPNP